MRDCNIQVSKFESTEVRMSEADRAEIYGRAKANRKRIKKGLAASQEPDPIGFETQGSYAMRTMIQYSDGDYDIDDGVYFEGDKLVGPQGGKLSGLDARKLICAAAQDERFKDPPEVRKNCVRVYYDEGYHVDVPVYRVTNMKNPFTGKETRKYELASADWKESDPVSVTEWFKSQNSSRSSDATKNGNDGQFVRIVRLLKKFARSRDSWSGSNATGFMITKLASDCFVEDTGRDDRALRETAQKILSMVSVSTLIKHPTLHENIADEDDARVRFFGNKLEENLVHLSVLDKVTCTHKEAMTAWDKFFGSDWFSAEPDPSEEDKLEKSVTGPAIIKGGSNRYA